MLPYFDTWNITPNYNDECKYLHITPEGITYKGFNGSYSNITDYRYISICQNRLSSIKLYDHQRIEIYKFDYFDNEIKTPYLTVDIENVDVWTKLVKFMNKHLSKFMTQ